MAVGGGGGGQNHFPATLPPRKRWLQIVQDARWASKSVWNGAENLDPTGIRSPERSRYTDYSISAPCKVTNKNVLKHLHKSLKLEKFSVLLM